MNDGGRSDLAQLRRARPLATHALASKEVAPPVANRAMWRADERRAMREGKLRKPG